KVQQWSSPATPRQAWLHQPAPVAAPRHPGRAPPPPQTNDLAYGPHRNDARGDLRPPAHIRDRFARRALGALGVRIELPVAQWLLSPCAGAARALDARPIDRP